MLSWVLWLPGLAGLYVAAYLLSTEVWRGQMGETRYRIRLFRSTWHLRIFEPLVAAEQRPVQQAPNSMAKSATERHCRQWKRSNDRGC